MKKSSTKKDLSPEHTSALLDMLKSRFEQNMHRHKGMKWESIEKRLKKSKDKVWTLSEMERTGGEPDVIGLDKMTDEFLFVDCAAETPKGRRSICYDQEALDSRKENKPVDSALRMAEVIGIDMLNEQQYRDLQKVEKVDEKTSSWIMTPPDIRELGGALFADRRYGHVFVYHNGASSYYAVRGFRGILRV